MVPDADEARTPLGALPAGTPITPQQFTVGPEDVQRYVDATGDDGFAPFARSVRAELGADLAPLTLFDRQMSTFLAKDPVLDGRIPPFGVHAGQITRYLAPLRVGRTYALVGEVLGVEARPGLDHLRVACRCVDVDAPDEVLIDAVWVRAQGFPDQRYGRSPSPRPPRPGREAWLRDAGADPEARFPAAGAVLQGRARRITQDHLDRYLGPGPNFHTDLALARRLGFETTVAAGLMATHVECDLYRERFGLALFTTATLDVRYVVPIAEGSVLTPWSVVQRSDGDAEGVLCLRTAVCTDAGRIVTTSRLTITP
jgi:acyl dehydratase